MDARAASVEFWCVAPEVSVERNDCAEPVRAGDIHEPADIFAGYSVELFVRPGTDGDELAVSAGRVVRGRRDSFEAELDDFSRIPRRVYDGLERSARTRGELFLYERCD